MLKHQSPLKSNITRSKKSTGSLHQMQLLFSGAGKCLKQSLVLFTVIMLGSSLPAIACEACKQQQPKILQGITHGPGPGSNWDYLIVAIMVIITVYTLYATIKCMIRPAEKDNQHIKRMILNQ